MIVNLYIETKNMEAFVVLEKLLRSNGFAFYDATNFDRYTTDESFKTLEDIEIDIEAK